MTLHRFAFPTPIHFGAGARRLVREELAQRGVRRPLLVTDGALARLPVLAEFRGLLDGLDVAVFDGVFGNPTAAQVIDGAVAFKAHRADAVIAFGGGATIDVAKMIAVMATHDGDPLDYAFDHAPKPRPIDRALPCLVALPTTAGTGSEVGRSAVIADEHSHVKRVIFSPRLLPQVVFADPELTLGLPPAVTAATGIDALTHNIESFLSPSYHPLCDGIALEGLRIGARALVTAVKEPHDLAARADMMMASMMGAIAFQKDLGAVHACAHALGAVAHLHHGLANALMIDTVLAWNQSAVPDRFDVLARAAGLSHGDEFVPWLARLKTEIGLAGGLAAHGVTSDDLPRLVRIAEHDVCCQTNPRPVTAGDLERLFRQAM